MERECSGPIEYYDIRVIAVIISAVVTRTRAFGIYTKKKNSTVVEGRNLSTRKTRGDSISKLIPSYNNYAIYNLQ